MDEFDSAAFEKRLQGLKDSQESVNSCCQWCLENRAHHKKIVAAWLNVLRRVRVEQRVTLFYLANDVIQYSKRRNYEFVESWGTTLQKATTMVRDERVKHKILRIFKIWEQRGVYNEDFITDLSGLLSATTAWKSDDPHEFQASYLINKIRNCTNLENDTDAKLKKLKEHNPKIQIEKSENLCSSLKDRAHVDDVEREIDEYAAHIEEYVNALKAEIKARSNLISLLIQADTQLESDKKDVKTVANAYKAFGTRVKNVKKKLDEMLPTLSSPIPSPDINAPSPSPDSDLDLPGSDNIPETTTAAIVTAVASTVAAVPPVPLPNAAVQSAGYYNQLPITSTDNTNSFNNNGFSSFIGSNMPFSLQNFNPSGLFTTNTTTSTTSSTQTTNSFNLNNSLSSFFQALVAPPPPPEAVPSPIAVPPVVATTTAPFQGVPPPSAVLFPPPPPQMPVPPPTTSGYDYGSGGGGGENHMPLLPPPMPPFSKEGGYGNNGMYGTYSTAPSSGYNSETTYETHSSDYQPDDYPYDVSQYSHSESSAYNDSVGSFTSESQQPSSWGQTPIGGAADWATDTPESPPSFEKEAYGNPIEYHDGMNHGGGGDVDHRLLARLPSPPQIEDSVMLHRGKDVDHRNLISLTGSPGDHSQQTMTKNNKRNSYKEKDRSAQQDQDYRVPITHEQQLNLLPPPPPPPSIKSPRKPLQDNVESIDMDLSEDDEQNQNNQENPPTNENIKVLVGGSSEELAPPPPPFPDLLPDDADANSLLDDLNEDLNSGEFEDNLLDETMPPPSSYMDWNRVASRPPPSLMQSNFGPPPTSQQPHQRQDFGNGSYRGRGNVAKRGWGGRGGRGYQFRGNNFRGRGFRPRGRGGFRGGTQFRGSF